MFTIDELKKAKKGDRKAIEQICLATWEPLYRFIYYKVQNREEAEDITQETYVKILKYLPIDKALPENFSGYLKTVALNILRDRWRQKKRRGTVLKLNDIYSEESAAVDHQKAVTQRLQLENALAKLSEDQRAILDLRIIKGYSAAETGRLLGKTEAAVRTSQYRALQVLARIIDGND